MLVVLTSLYHHHIYHLCQCIRGHTKWLEDSQCQGPKKKPTLQDCLLTRQAACPAVSLCHA